MKKITNNYRKCPNCPHHRQLEQKCCCQRNSTVTRVRPVTSRNKRQTSTIDNSTVNTTIPNVSAINTTVPTIIAQYSALRTQNNHLKRELLNVSTFLKEQNQQSSPSSDIFLNEKLFLSNKNLKQALLEIDALSKANKQLCERNSYIVEQNQGFKIQLSEVEDYLEKYKRKYKKMYREHENVAFKEEVESLMQKNIELQEETKLLKDEIRCLRFQNRNYNMIGGLSPEWVAHTGNKVRPQQLHKVDEEPKEDIQIWKKSLSETINLLRNQGSHINSSFVDLSNINKFNSLIEQLLSSYSQSILGYFQLVIKEITRKMNNYEKKVDNLFSKLENVMMLLGNKRLKHRMKPLTQQKTERVPMLDLTNRMI